METKLEAFDSKSIVKTLEGLMIKVTNDDCTPETVNAACNCAARITDILRVHFEAARISAQGQALRSQIQNRSCEKR